MTIGSQPITINHRYHLLDRLGAGGMGIVYRAYDRLTQQYVALKQVVISPEHLVFTSRVELSDPAGLLLSLAREFRILASLRHPNIISVLDYGFDRERRPFFTMELLAAAQNLRAAGVQQPLPVQVNLLVQTLQALAYLHRRGILHHDLKPENVLVSHGQVQVLDFGLSVMQDQAQRSDSLGTLLYLPPEVLAGGVYTPAADLYAVGLMAYELLVGRHPFYTGNLDELFTRIVTATPDLTPIPLPLRSVIGTLLAKEPTQRYADAADAIRALSAALAESPPVESLPIRESFLQAAKFVGRSEEMVALTTALGAAQRHCGSAWLIRGESGVGKSRLLDELRTQALVAGVLVLRGQAVEGGGLPYQLWREPLRQLVIATELSDPEASVLKELIPDIGVLLQREIKDPPPLTGEAGRQRLAATIVELLQRQSRPILLLLEDLQWSREIDLILPHLILGAAQHPLLIVGSYRDDELPQLPTQLPAMYLIKLARLSESELAELSFAMLGERAGEPGLLALLQRETEGNTFFLVEVVRTLAEAAGSLAAVGRTGVPQQVLAGGVQQLLQRRLARIPAQLQPLLQLAALAGRHLDLTLLGHFTATQSLTPWLVTCADAGVLEVYDNRWRFCHDKLRETIIAGLSDDIRPALHRQVAETIERIYPDDESRTEMLLEHWRLANVEQKELPYLQKVVERLIRLGLDYPRAGQLLERGLRLAQHAPDSAAQQLRLLRWAGSLGEWTSAYAAGRQALNRCLGLAQALDDQVSVATALRGLGRIAWRTGSLHEAQQLYQQSLDLYRQLEHRTGIADALADLGNVLGALGDRQTCIDYLHQALAIYQELDNQEGIAITLNDLAATYDMSGQSQQAMAYLRQSLAIAQATDNRQLLVINLINMAVNAQEASNFAVAYEWLLQAQKLAASIHARRSSALILANLGQLAFLQDDYPKARAYSTQAVQLAQELDNRLYVVRIHIDLYRLAFVQGEWPTALAHIETALTIGQSLEDRTQVTSCLLNRGILRLHLGENHAAEADLQQGLALAGTDAQQLLLGILGYAQLYLQQGQIERAAELTGLAQSHPMLLPLLKKFRWQPLLDQLAAVMPPARLAIALQRGTQLELQTTVQAILR